MAEFIMVVGTSSNSGKTTITAGLCRILANKGYKVAPFKSQNMSLNSRVAKEDGEIAIAQYTQSLACRVEPSVHFNPILLKPKGNFTSQVIVHGKPYKDMNYNEYRKNKDFFLKKIKESLEILNREYDYVVMEGAGSCCEINLLKDDIANLRIAEMVNAKAILVADIDRGGVFASIYGTIKLLPEKWRKLIKGIVINKFRGNVDVLKEGIEKIEELTGIPVLGIVPYDENLVLPEEDSQSIQKMREFGNIKSGVEIDVVKFSKISNFTDLDPLRYDAHIKFLDFKDDITGDILVLPGTRSSTKEAMYLRKYNFEEKILDFLKEGGVVIGICGGYQVLGEKLIDRERKESEIGDVDGLSIFNAKTYLGNEKVIKNSRGVLSIEGKNFNVFGYEIHEGITHSREKPLIKVERGFGNRGDGFDGAIKRFGDGIVIGTYFHGIFENYMFRNYIINIIRKKKGLEEINHDSYKDSIERNLNYFAEIVEKNVNLNPIFEG
ncbi:cobyric acid synthase CobQ [Methanocaldococcus vulcanius]|nr:cobyric acid synthase CobQ [Methanocaldococcus vulcanius]